MKINVRLLFLMAVAAMCPVSEVSAAGWTPPASCGAEPSMPVMDVSSVAKYNASVDKATEYQKAARVYHSCVVKAASKEETTISNEARDKIARVHEGSQEVQKRIASRFTQISVALKAGNKKFSNN